MPFTAQELRDAQIQRVIFHNVPCHGVAEVELADVPTKLDARRRALLGEKLTGAVRSRRAYRITFDAATTSPVPPAIAEMTSEGAGFVAHTHTMAHHLHIAQNRAISPGLLGIIDMRLGGDRSIALMKLDLERAARLTLSGKQGQRQFEMTVLDGIVLAESTRLFKAALFRRTGANTYRSAACDAQGPIGHSGGMAQFWLKFLGCTYFVEPRIATRRFFDATLEFLNSRIPDPIAINDVYESLHAEMRSQRHEFSPIEFIDLHVPQQFQASLREFYQGRGIPIEQFRKDTSDIKGKLRNRRWVTRHGAHVVVPADAEGLVEVGEDDITVHDQVSGAGAYRDG